GACDRLRRQRDAARSGGARPPLRRPVRDCQRAPGVVRPAAAVGPRGHGHRRLRGLRRHRHGCPRDGRRPARRPDRGRGPPGDPRRDAAAAAPPRGAAEPGAPARGRAAARDADQLDGGGGRSAARQRGAARPVRAGPVRRRRPSPEARAPAVPDGRRVLGRRHKRHSAGGRPCVGRGRRPSCRVRGGVRGAARQGARPAGAKPGRDRGRPARGRRPDPRGRTV
ncbi:MAG: Cryptic haloacid dehalogenase 1, partial [uncultured Thermomicrobiales bacterium]